MLKIILIEDNLGDARLIQEMLEETRQAMPFEFESFNRLSSGLERLARGEMNVVLLDLGLPDSQGFNTFFKVYGQTKQVPIIVLTGLDDRELADKALREGAQDYLVKGQIDSNILERSIRYAIERKQVEKELKKYHLHLEELVEERTKQLRETNKELEAFVYSASHDLKNPLHTIEGFAKILLEDYSIYLDADGQRFLNIISSNTKRMTQLIRDLLDFSHLGHTQIKLLDIDIKEQVNSVFEELKPSIKQTTQLDIKPLLSAKGDLSLIRQVFINLLSNAIKFTRTREQPIIEVGSKVEVNQNVYYIKDNGIGFDMQDANKLFVPFKRLQTTQEFEGTGIGLAIVERIISKHNGRVWAEGIVDEGATFYFALPNITQN